VNFLAIVKRLHREAGRSSAAPITVATDDVRQLRLVDAARDAWNELQRERDDWRWMRRTLDATLTIGQQTYSATSDFSATRFGRWRKATVRYWPILYIDGSPNAQWPLDFRQLDDFRQEWIYRQNGNSTPLDWSCDETDRLLLGPAPALAYKLRQDYVMEPFELGTGNADPNLDEPDMPERFHLLLVWKALMAVAVADAKPEILKRAEDQYAPMFSDLLLDQATELPHL
jgi:hypothetical protein